MARKNTRRSRVILTTRNLDSRARAWLKSLFGVWLLFRICNVSLKQRWKNSVCKCFMRDAFMAAKCRIRESSGNKDATWHQVNICSSFQKLSFGKTKKHSVELQWQGSQMNNNETEKQNKTKPENWIVTGHWESLMQVCASDPNSPGNNRLFAGREEEEKKRNEYW